jgi:hypothetical protein
VRFAKLFLVPAVLLYCGCFEDYDVEEVAPAEFLGGECSHDDHNHIDDSLASVDEETQGAHDSGPSDHEHAAGERNHGTQWLFNQPWAAPFIWGKLAWDGIMFLGLAVLIILVSGRRKR